MLPRDEYSKMMAFQIEVEQRLLSRYGIHIKTDSYLNKNEAFPEYIMKVGKKVNNFIQKNLSEYENEIYETIKNCII